MERQVLDRLVERFESNRPEPWVNRLETDFMSRLQAAIVAFEIPIDASRANSNSGRTARWKTNKRASRA